MKKFVIFVLAMLIAGSAYADATIFSNIGTLSMDVYVPGTERQLSATSIGCAKVIITALSNNAGVICIGDKNVVAATAGRKGIPLVAGQSITLPVSDVSMVWIDATVAGDGVSAIYMR